ncbi:pyridoxine 5'-phosphate synthase [Tahibacter amnicola]|uniref:Pyridoxine 5'-phosphate synthase n=1 Tax=Tahibacter amnicola TaxID=2976241 RepID=A0ABY6BH69_9GAMM|nr:pyridoxine 5'-phosphate synthase [Tahibacter amnicola]UXI68420.1 pyridoxine 5'-phosphate synthase [Tahibacter amnicola]
MTVLSVNLNKIAVLRNSRGDDEPDIRKACETVIAAGAGGITVHPRPDQRHVRPGDVDALVEQIGGRVEFNIEGNGFAGPRGSYPGLVALVAKARPAQCTLVPDSDAQITSDHGFDLAADAARLRPLIAELKAQGARVSLFVDADCPDVERAAELGADRIEIYTGPYAKAFARGDHGAALADCVRVAERAHAAGLGVNAGHDLNQANLGTLRQAIPQLAEVSIGHALIGEALYDGLSTTVARYLAILSGNGTLNISDALRPRP